MKKIYFLALVFGSLNSFAQEKLKPIVNRYHTDTAWSTSNERIYTHIKIIACTIHVVFASVYLKKDSKLLILNPQANDIDSDFRINNGSKAFVKLKDSSMIELVCKENYKAEPNTGVQIGTMKISANAFGMYDLTDAVISKLADVEIAFLLIESSTGNFDCEIKAKNAKDFRKQFALIASRR